MKTNQHQRKSPEFVSKVFGLRTFHPFTRSPLPHTTPPNKPLPNNQKKTILELKLVYRSAERRSSMHKFMNLGKPTWKGLPSGPLTEQFIIRNRTESQLHLQLHLHLHRHLKLWSISPKRKVKWILAAEVGNELQCRREKREMKSESSAIGYVTWDFCLPKDGDDGDKCIYSSSYIDRKQKQTICRCAGRLCK